MVRHVASVLRIFYAATIVTFLVFQGYAKSSPQVLVTVALEQASIRVGKVLGFQFTITNHWKDHTLRFITCPPPYEMEVFDSNGNAIPKSEAWQQQIKNGGWTCASTLMQEVAPGQALGPYSTAGNPRMFDLKPGDYSARLKWNFSTTTGAKHKPGKEISVPSNTSRFTVVP